MDAEARDLFEAYGFLRFEKTRQNEHNLCLGVKVPYIEQLQGILKGVCGEMSPSNLQLTFSDMDTPRLMSILHPVTKDMQFFKSIIEGYYTVPWSNREIIWKMWQEWVELKGNELLEIGKELQKKLPVVDSNSMS